MIASASASRFALSVDFGVCDEELGAILGLLAWTKCGFDCVVSAGLGLFVVDFGGNLGFLIGVELCCRW